MKSTFFLLCFALSLSLPIQASQNFVPGNRGLEMGERLFERVVLDAGHGGKDPGAAGHTYAIEKDLALKLTEAVGAGLRARGFDVKMTRDADVFVPLDERSARTNEWKPDLFVSIHLNASESPKLGGFEVYTLSEDTDDTALARERSRKAGRSTELDVILRDMAARENRRRSVEVARGILEDVASRAPVEAKRHKAANFRVLKGAECPSVLVEAGYLTHRRDRSRLRNPRYRQRLADSIVEAILKFKTRYEATDGFAR